MSTPTDPALDAAWRPTVDDVAALLRARTKDASGNEIGTFTDQTRPTDAEVETLITNGCGKVAAYVGWEFASDAYDEAKHLAALVAACEVELSYWPEQVRSNRSAFEQLWQMFQAAVDQFTRYVETITPAGGTVAQEFGSLYTPSASTVFAYQWGYGGIALSDLVNVGLGP